jgi:ubiquinone/menaquinone biosynthesis C-methylase UbiE
MIELANNDLTGKIVLEIGSGQGNTTRMLVDLLSSFTNTVLIASDLSDRFFSDLAQEFQARQVEIRFLQSNAAELNEIASSSIDYIVCNYTLCAVEAHSGLAAIALHRFYEVLREGGSLYIEEEFPIDRTSTYQQGIWAEKWRILKAAQLAAGLFPYREIDPQVLSDLCRLAGFDEVEWEEQFTQKATSAGGMTVPYYCLRATRHKNTQTG